MQQRNLAQRLVELNQASTQSAQRKAFEAIAEDIFRKRDLEQLSQLAEQVSSRHRDELTAGMTNLMGEVMKGMAKLESALAAVAGKPDPDMSGVYQALAQVRGDIAQLPAPEVPPPPTIPTSSSPLGEPSGVREPRNYRFTVERDEDGFISSVSASEVNDDGDDD